MILPVGRIDLSNLIIYMILVEGFELFVWRIWDFVYALAKEI